MECWKVQELEALKRNGSPVQPWMLQDLGISKAAAVAAVPGLTFAPDEAQA